MYEKPERQLEQISDIVEDKVNQMLYKTNVKVDNISTVDRQTILSYHIRNMTALKDAKSDIDIKTRQSLQKFKQNMIGFVKDTVD